MSPRTAVEPFVCVPERRASMAHVVVAAGCRRAVVLQGGKGGLVPVSRRCMSAPPENILRLRITGNRVAARARLMALAPPERARLERIAAALQADDAEWLRTLLEPGARSRLDRRDYAVRELLLLFRPLPCTIAARRLAHALDRYLTTAWRAEKASSALPDDTDPQHRLLHSIARENAGRSLSWRQIVNLAAGHRGS